MLHQTLPRRVAVFHSRTKSVEWLMSAFMVAWGVTLLWPGDTLSMKVYLEFRKIGINETNLISFYLTIAFIRIYALYMNGALKKGPAIRLFCSGVGSFTWLFTAMLFVMPTIYDSQPLPVNFLHHIVMFFGEIYAVGVAAVDRRANRS